MTKRGTTVILTGLAACVFASAAQAEVYVYPNCKDGKVVADIARIDKGHTEGLEPKVSEELVKLMVSAKGGKIQQAP